MKHTLVLFNGIFAKLLIVIVFQLLYIQSFAQVSDSVIISGVVKSTNFFGPARNHAVYLLPDSNSANYFPTLSTLTDSNGIFSFRAPNLLLDPNPFYNVVVPDCNLNNVFTRVSGSNGYGYAIVGICTSAQVRNLITINGTLVPTDSNMNVGNLPISINPDSISIATGNLFNNIIGFTDHTGKFQLRVPYDSGQAKQDYIIITTCTGLPIITRATSFANADLNVAIAFSCQPPVLSPVAKVKGRVIYANGSPVPSYSVSAWQVGSAWSDVKTDSLGMYYFPQLPAGSYIFQAMPLGPDSNGFFGLPAYAPSATDWQSATVYALDSGDSRTIDIILPSPFPLTGTDSITGVLVYDSTINSNLRVAYTMPFHYKNARIIVTNKATGKDIAISAIDANGRWRIAGLPTGNYAVRVEYPKVSTPLVSATIPGTSSVNFTMRGGSLVARVNADNANSVFSIFPNPAKDFINVISGMVPNTIEVLNTLGQVVYKQNECHTKDVISVSQLAAGVYSVVVKYDNAVQTARLVIK